ncbi:MAG: hypothetical protein IKU51_05885 [Clostridia bacterium]|nr:hypothetical protein [Clostridia bacterium]
MTVGVIIARVMVLLLSVYGCAQLIRRVCLWFARCPSCVTCCKLAVPRSGTALAPLLRCLQSQAVWEEPDGCRCTLLVLSEQSVEDAEELEKLLSQYPAVVAVKPEQLGSMLAVLAKE